MAVEKNGETTGRDDRGQFTRGNRRGFQPGRSGNPGGRPATEREMRASAQQRGPEAIRRLVHVMRHGEDSAVIAAARAILDRGYGRFAQQVDLEVRQEAAARGEDGWGGPEGTPCSR